MMSDTEDPETAAERLETALERIAQAAMRGEARESDHVGDRPVRLDVPEQLGHRQQAAAARGGRGDDERGPVFPDVLLRLLQDVGVIVDVPRPASRPGSGTPNSVDASASWRSARKRLPPAWSIPRLCGRGCPARQAIHPLGQ